MCQIMNYKDYLKSNHWKELRSKKYTKKRKCAICRYKNNLETHHFVYKNLYNVETSDLRVLCRGCHSLIHLLVKDKKLTLKGLSVQGMLVKSKSYIKLYKKNPNYLTYWRDKRLGKI